MNRTEKEQPMKNIEKKYYQWFVELAEQARLIVPSDATWEDKYMAIYHTIRVDVEITGIEVKYSIKSQTQEDFARGYAEALMNRAESIKHIAEAFRERVE